MHAVLIGPRWEAHPEDKVGMGLGAGGRRLTVGEYRTVPVYRC